MPPRCVEGHGARTRVPCRRRRRIRLRYNSAQGRKRAPAVRKPAPAEPDPASRRPASVAHAGSSSVAAHLIRPESPRRPMPAPENDLAAILRLLDPATFPPRGAAPRWTAERHAAVVALCWLVGLRPLHIGHMRRRDWRPGGRDVALTPGIGQFAGVRDREMPVLERARDAVDAYLRACPLPHPPDGPLILRANGAGFDARDVARTDRRLWQGLLRRRADARRPGGALPPLRREHHGDGRDGRAARRARQALRPSRPAPQGAAPGAGAAPSRLDDEPDRLGA